MRCYILVLFINLTLLFPFGGTAQTIVLEDDFEDEDITTSPSWTGDTGSFTTFDDSGNNLLQLNAADAGTSYLSTTSVAAYGSWEFFIRFDNFSLSGSNNITVFLISDIAELTGDVTGYALVAGKSGSDDVFELIRYDQGVPASTIMTGTTVVNGGGDYQVQVARNSNGEWTLSVASGYGSIPTAEATGTDNTHTTSSYFGFMPEYTSTRSDRFFFDDVTVAKAPIKLASAEVINNLELRISFTDDLDPSTVESTDFSVDNGIGNPTGISVAGNAVALSYNTPLPGGDYTLTVNGISDQSGTSLPSNSTINFSLFDTFMDGDIVINEFMYNQPEGLAEYIEIHNTTTKRFNLTGWKLGDSNEPTSISSDTLILKANDFLVITSDTTTLFDAFGTRNYVEMSSFPSLNNTGDAVRIYTATDSLVDSLYYSPEWGGDNISLERISSTTSAIYAENWGPSPNPAGGTPGLPNEVSEDIQPPQVIGYKIMDAQTLLIFFSERLTNNSADNTLNYSLNGDISISNAITIEPDTVQLQLNSSLQNATNYTLTLSGVEDIFGNAITNFQLNFTYYEISEAESGDLFVNEFMFDPPGNATEYIELYNPTQKSLNLEDWTLNDNTGSKKVITHTHYVLPPDSFVVLAPDSSLLSVYPEFSLIVMGNSFPSLNNSGDDIVIRRTDGLLLDSLSYNSDWGGNETALERRTTTLSGIYRENWGEAPQNTGSPGFVNSIPADVTPPALQNYEILSSTEMRLIFSEQLVSSSATSVDNYQLSDGLPISTINFSPPDTVNLHFQQALQNATSYILTIDGLLDLFGNSSTSQNIPFTFYEISEADSGSVFINEFVYDPPEGLTELIELYNPTQQSFDLQNWSINDNTGTRRTITSSSFVLPPDTFVVVAPDSSLLNTFENANLVVMGNRFPSLNNSGDDLVLRRSDGTLLDSLSFTSTWGGSNHSLERRTTAVSGIYRENWGDSPGSDGATPGGINLIDKDETPPKISSVKILDGQTLSLVFDERVTNSSASNIDNFSLSGGTEINNTQFTIPNTVEISLDIELQNAVSYTLSATGIEDVFGNRSSTLETNFTFFDISEPDSGDIFINEFLFEPAEGSTEFIELYNPTEKSFDLQNWTINDNTGTRRNLANNQFILPPDSFVVIAPDSTLSQTFSEFNLLTLGNRFPPLNNSGDDIVLRDSRGTVLDSLRYDATWDGDEVSLERRSLSISAVYSENWGEAPNDTGSPGRNNTIQPDQTAPEIVRFSIIDKSAIQLTFSEKIKSQTATQIGNYTISPSVGIQLISILQDTVTLFLAEQLTSGTTYEVTVSNIQDIFGNTMESITLTREYLLFTSARPGDVVINEILYKRSNATSPEFVELYNPGSKNFDLTGWKLGDGTNLVDIPDGIQLKPGEYLIITDSKELASQKYNSIYLPDFPSLNNREDALYIRSQEQVTIDSLYYSASWGGSDGISMERKDPEAASNDPANWTTSKAQEGTSAGDKNDSFAPDKTPPEIIFAARRTDNLIEVRFNEFIRLTDDLSISLDGADLQVENFDSTNGNQILLRRPSTKTAKPKSHNIIAIQNLEDIKGNNTSATSIAVAEPMEPGSVVINEIMYNPLNDSDDNHPDQAEYLELRNVRDYAISLEGFRLHDAPDEDEQVRLLTPVSSSSKYLPANGYMLIYAEEKARKFSNSRTAAFFELSDLNSSNTARINRGTLSLASSDDAIYLADSTGTTIDSVYYDASWQNPNILDTRGVALERINPTGPSNERSNWSSSITEKGGTPGGENSIFQVPTDQPEKMGISFSPNPFSPDEDGRDDQLFINYKLDQPDYLLKVRIFDRYGRLVRELADGDQAGFKGSLQWDGKTDDGNRNRIGIYIVLFEAYNSNNGSDRIFKEVVVLARQM